MSSIVQFQPFSSLVQPAFWHALTDIKIDVLKLSDDQVPLRASYTTGKSIKDRETGQQVILGSNLSLGGDAFSKEQQRVHRSCHLGRHHDLLPDPWQPLPSPPMAS
jgi:ubiquitin-like modifier-activating enzyme ATG7